MSSNFSPDSLVPARFLTLLANLIILVLALWSRESNVMASLPQEFEDDEYNAKDKELIIGLSLGIGTIGIEFIGFFTGISMFRTSISLLSIFLHGFACFSTSQWLLYSWQTSSYWAIFFLCSVMPAIVELITIICSFVESPKEF